MEPRPRKVVRISRNKVLFGSIVLVALILFAAQMSMSTMGLKPVELRNSEIPGVASSPTSYPYDGGYGRPYNGTSDITDTREFLKVSYNGNIKTRDVSDVVKDVKGAIREVEGRIDSESTSPQHGYVSFVVPKSTFENFRAQIESITHAKLYTETVSSQNLLGEKQGIEQNMQAATTSLATLEQEKKTLDAKHAQASASIKRDTTSVQSQLVSVRQRMNTAQDENEYASLQTEESTLNYRLSVLQENLNKENRTYANQNANLVAYIEQAKKTVDGVVKQDTQFTNNVETVNGYVAVQWVSLWDLAVLFSPVHPCIVILILIAIAIFYTYRKGYIPKVEFV
ncbi:MAG: hypothetical protein V4519_00890 [Patescibacteria group bacterium]